MKAKQTTFSIDKPMPSVDPSTVAPLTEWENEPTVLKLGEDLRMAQPSHDAQVNKIHRWRGLRDATGKYKPKTAPNRSSVQPKLVRRQAEWRYSALSEPFLSAELLFQVTPKSFEDVKGATQNQLLLNHQFDTKINKVRFIDEYVRTAVDDGTVAVRLGWRRETKIVETMVPLMSYMTIQNQGQLDQLQQALALQQEDPRGYSELPIELMAAVDYFHETGTPAVAVQSGDFMAVQEEKILVNQPTVDILDFENLYIDPNAGGDLNKASFAVISFETSKAELLKDGRYTNLDKVNWSSASPLHQPEHVTRADNSMQFSDDLRKRVVAYEYWGLYDIHGNDELVPIVATWIGSTMIRMEENPFPDQKIPVVVESYMPVRKSIAGEPDAELLEDNQAILGAVTRGIIDLMGRSANGQTGIAKGMLDSINRRRYNEGKDYEYNPSMQPSAGFYQHQFPELPASALTVLQLQNQEAEALTGVKAFSGGLSGEAYGEVAAGIRGLLDAASKREMSILRRLASGVEQIGRKITAMNGAFLSEDEVVRVSNEEFVRVNREEIAGEYDFKVDITTAEIEEAKAQDLGFMLQTMGNTLDWKMTQAILVQIAKLKRMPELARMIERFEPQQDPLQQKIKELEIAKLEREIAKLEAEASETRSNAMLHEARARAVASQADLSDLTFLEQESGTTHAREMERQGAQAEANEKLEITKHLLDASTDPEKSLRKAANSAADISRATQQPIPSNVFGMPSNNML